jgi:ankyrin repeat protein
LNVSDDRWAPLHYAAAAGPEATTTRLIKNGHNIEERTTLGQSGLHLAVTNGRIATTTILIDKGANVICHDHQGRTLLDSAYEKKQVATARIVFKNQQSHNHPNKPFLGSVAEAARANDESVAWILLENGCDPGAITEPENLDAICWAARLGNISMVRMLLDHGSSVNPVISCWCSPLLEAVSAPCRAVGPPETYAQKRKIQPRRGTNVDYQGSEEETPLNLASAVGDVELVKLFLGRGANIEYEDGEGKTPLNLAAAYGHLDLVKLFLQQGAKVDCFDKFGKSALCYAAKTRSIPLCQLLLDYGASESTTDVDGFTPFFFAGSTHSTIVGLFL